MSCWQRWLLLYKYPIDLKYHNWSIALISAILIENTIPHQLHTLICYFQWKTFHLIHIFAHHRTISFLIIHSSTIKMSQNIYVSCRDDEFMIDTPELKLCYGLIFIEIVYLSMMKYHALFCSVPNKHDNVIFWLIQFHLLISLKKTKN